MKELKIRWFPDSALRFLELLRDLDWNSAVRVLRVEKEERENSLVEAHK